MSTPREPHELSRELNSVLADHAPLQYGVGYPDAGVPPFYTLSAIPLRRINLTENHGDNLFQNKARSLSSLAAVALLILAIAIFNVSNLFASRARNRLREHLVRRTLGANNFQFTTQFIVEAVLVSVSAMIVAASIVSISVNLLASTGIRTHWSWNDPVIALSIALVTITVALSIGIPPAIPFARQYGKKRSTANPPWRRLDRVHPITITQFSVAVGLGCIAVVTGNNLWHLAKNDPGYDGSDVMIVWDTDVLPNRDAFVHAIRGLPSVKMVAEAGTVPTDFNRFSMSVGNRDSDDTQTFQLVNIDTHTFPLLNIETIAGRTFQSNRVADIVAHGADTNLQIIVTKSGAAVLGYEHASDILGKQFRQLYAAKQEEQWRLASVIGVTNDIAFQSIQDPIEPTVFVQDPMAFSRVLIRVDPDQREQVVTSITEEWRKISPFHPLQIDWLDTRRDDGIRSEMQQAYLLISGATFAYILALIGLIALASKTLRAMSKEIALRKVLGATPWSIAIKTIRHFTLAMGIAVTIALPISMIINQNIEVSSTGGEASTVWLYFLVAAAAVVVSGAIVMTQALIAGSKPPMDSLGA